MTKIKNHKDSDLSYNFIYEFYDIPLIGEVKAEDPYGSEGNYSLGELISNFKNRKTHSITLRAVDNGLVLDGIYPGDYLTIIHNQDIKNGDISAIILGSRIYIRKLYREKKRFRLETTNPAVPHLVIEEKTPGFEIIGKISTVIREL